MPRYKSVHTGPQIDSGVARALPGGEIDQLRPNRNLLDNWDFRNPVNQRGASGTISEAGYFIDRWKLVSGTVAITQNGLSLNGTIRQIRETAIGATVKASVGMYSGTATITYDDTTKYCDITSSGGTIARCKLEVGTVSTLPNDPPADYGEELRKCQRYYFKRHFAQFETISLGYLGAEWLILAVGIGAPMHTNTPTLVVIGNLVLLGAQASSAIVPANAACSGCTANLVFSATASTQGACYAYSPDAAGATISLSADL